MIIAENAIAGMGYRRQSTSQSLSFRHFLYCLMFRLHPIDIVPPYGALDVYCLLLKHSAVSVRYRRHRNMTDCKPGQKYRQIEKTHVSPWEQHSHPFTRHIDVSPIYQSFYRDKHFGLSSLASLVDENMGEVATSYPNTSQHGHRNTRRDDDSKPFHDNKKRYAERGPIVKIIVVICVRF